MENIEDLRCEAEEIKSDIQISIKKLGYLSYGESKRIYEMWIEKNKTKLKDLEDKIFFLENF